MEEKTLKENILALTFWFAVAVLALAGGVVGESIKEGIQVALDGGDTTAAITRLEHEMGIDPSYHYNYYVLGQILYNRGQIAEARDQYAKAQSKKKKFYESLYSLGLCELELGNLEAAAEAFKTGLKKARKMKDLFEYGTALVQMENKEYQEADRSLRRALAINPDVADYHLALGDVNFYQKIPSLAVSEYEKALALDTASTEVFFHWAEACLEMKEYTCAIEKLRIVLTKDSTFAEAWNRAGSIYYKAARSSRNRAERSQRFIDVIGSYEKYFELTGVSPDSSTVRAYYETAMSYQNIRRYEDAIPYFDKVLAIPMEPRDIYFYLGKCLWGVRDYVRAAEMMHKHTEWVNRQNENYKSRINQAEFNKILGDAYFYRKNSKPFSWDTTAVSIVKSSGSQDSLVVTHLRPKSVVNLSADYYNAVKYYKLSLAEKDGVKRLIQNVAVSFHNMKRYGEALEYYDLRIAEGIDSTSSSIYKNAALCALHIAGGSDEDEEMMDDEEEDGGEYVPPGIDPTLDYNIVALGYINSYLEFKPDDTGMVERVANTYLYQLSDCANGVAAFERLLELQPDNCQAKKSLGFAYFGGDICSTNLSKTLKHLRAAYNCLSAAGGACDDPALVKWIAQAYHLRAVDASGDANADYKNAFEWYGKVLKCTPSDSEAKKGQEDTRFEFN